MINNLLLLNLQPSLMSLFPRCSLGFARSCWTPIGRVISFRDRTLLNFLCLCCFSTPPEIDCALRIAISVRARANMLLDIRAWCVHSRVPPATSWWATCTVDEINSAKFLCQYKAWALSELFIQWKFCAVRVQLSRGFCNTPHPQKPWLIAAKQPHLITVVHHPMA